jgi:hypothetical protein
VHTWEGVAGKYVRVTWFPAALSPLPYTGEAAGCAQYGGEARPSLRLLSVSGPVCCGPLLAATRARRLTRGLQDFVLAFPLIERSEVITAATMRTQPATQWNMTRCNRTLLYVSEERISSVIRVKHSTWSVAWVRQRTIPTERPPIVGEVSAKFCG